MKHFANFVFVNATRFDVSDLPVNVFGMAFKSSEQQSTALGSAHSSLVLMNMGNSSALVDTTQARFGTFIGSALTSQDVDWQFDTTKSTDVLLPALSIVTLLFA